MAVDGAARTFVVARPHKERRTSAVRMAVDGGARARDAARVQ